MAKVALKFSVLDMILHFDSISIAVLDLIPHFDSISIVQVESGTNVY